MGRIVMVLLFVSVSWAFEARFDNYKVYSIIPENAEQLKNVHNLEKSGLPLDFWTDPRSVNLPVDVMVPPHIEAEFHEFVINFKMNVSVKHENVQSLVDESRPKPNLSRIGRKLDWTSYYELSEINEWLANIARKHWLFAKLITVGQSYEGRVIKGVKVSYRTGNKAVVFEGGIHAREWISPATVTYILNELLTSKNSAIRKIARSYDWYFIPVVNPDGYEYTFNYNRLWRKTRSRNGICLGADANRNWNYHWNETGTGSQCIEFFPGTAPFSEPEIKSLSEYLKGITKKQQIAVYLAIHSPFQQLLIPYAFGEHANNYDELLEIAQKAAASLTNRHGTSFEVGNWAEIMYPSSGVSMDWVKAELKVPIAYTYELRSKLFGFLLPPKSIIPVCEETMDSILTLVNEVKARGY